MSDAIDRALKARLLTPPENFAERVLAGLPVQPIQGPARRPAWREAVEWLAVTGAALAGMAQLIPLLFGIWAFGSAA